MKKPAHTGAGGLHRPVRDPARALGNRLQQRRGRQHHERFLPLGHAEGRHQLQRLPAGRLRRLRRALPGALSPARPRRLDERLDADEEHARRADRRGGDSADDRDHARRALEQPRELLRRLGVQGRGSRPAGGDGVHVRSDPARRRRVSDRCRPLGPRHRRLLDGRLRRDALLARASRSLRRRDRAQPGRLLPRSRRSTPARASSEPSARARSCSSRRSTSS